MRNIHSQPDALATLKTRLEALDRAGGRRVGAGVLHEMGLIARAASTDKNLHVVEGANHMDLCDSKNTSPRPSPHWRPSSRPG